MVCSVTLVDTIAADVRGIGFSPIRNQEVTEKEWDDPKTLISLLGEQLVSIAVTPNG